MTGAAPTTGRAPANIGLRLQQIFVRLGVLPFLLAIAIAVFTLLSDRFLTLQNGLNVTRQSSFLVMVAMGQMLALLTGGFDLSVGTILAVTSVFGAAAMAGMYAMFPDAVLFCIVVGMLALTIMAVVTTPPQEEATLATTLSEQILLGQDVYSIQCVECHGADGEGGEIKGVEGLEGVVLKPINSQDEMYTRSDDTLFTIIDYGQPDLGMPPFGKGYGGELSRGDIQSLVNFMRYTWDDRSELPEEVAQAGAIPALGPGEVPSYEVHIAPIIKRYCASCHRPGKKNNNYLMRDYNETMTSGDHVPNIIAGNLESNLILMLDRQEIEAGGPMPPTKALKPDLIDIFRRWVLGGAPNTAAEAAALSAPSPLATPEATPAVTPTP
jgi:mono/diheme cytochrome c family protein